MAVQPTYPTRNRERNHNNLPESPPLFTCYASLMSSWASLTERTLVVQRITGSFRYCSKLDHKDTRRCTPLRTCRGDELTNAPETFGRLSNRPVCAHVSASPEELWTIAGVPTTASHQRGTMPCLLRASPFKWRCEQK